MLDIAAILGHKTLAMVKRYSHLPEQHTTAAIESDGGEVSEVSVPILPKRLRTEHL